MKMENEPISLKFVAVTALIGQHEGEKGVNGLERYARYALAKRIYAGDGDLSPSEIEKLKTLIGGYFVPMIVGVAYDTLDGKPVTPVKNPEAILADLPTTPGVEP